MAFSKFDIGACNCAGGVGTTSCSPCNIPDEDLTVSWTNALFGPGSATMTYTTGPTAWTASCVDGGLIFKLSCVSGNILLTVTYFLSGSCPTGGSNYCGEAVGYAGGWITLASHTCSPFSLTFNVTEADCPILYSAGNTQFVITV